MDTEALRRNLPELRIRRGWSQADLGKRANVRADTVSSIERGRHAPRPSTLRRLAEALDVEVEELFEKPTAAAAQSEAIMLSDDAGEALAERVRTEEDPYKAAGLEEIEGNVLGLLTRHIKGELNPILLDMLADSIPSYGAGLASYTLRQWEDEGKEDLEGVIKDNFTRLLMKFFEAYDAESTD